MKKSFLIFATALLVASCGNNNDKAQKQVNETPVPQNVTVASEAQTTSQVPNTTSTLSQTVDPNTPVLKMEDGKPLDFSQLIASQNAKAEKMKAMVDTIRIKAEQGNPDYQYAYGMCLEKGYGVEKNERQALDWFKKAAEHGHERAPYVLGTGIAVNQNNDLAFSYFRQGAEAKEEQAMLNLGNCYFYGMGTTKDEKMALKWWTAAAEAGNAYALSQVGDCYCYGIGVEKDYAKAAAYYTQAAEKNVPNALYRLGLLYYSGEGVEQDRTQAEMLMMKARDGGMKEAGDFLDKYYK